MPALLPAEFFKETGRWDVYGDTLFRLKDRKGGEFHLGPTHEEIVTDIARREIKSWRDMPVTISSCVGPRWNSPPLRSFKRKSVSP